MKVFQQLASTCSCAFCQQGCLCGDCAGCSNKALDRAILRNAKRLSALACLLVVLGSFVFFVPVVTLGATPTITETFSVRVQPAQNVTSTMGSISLCLFGQGAVLVHGAYYPDVAVNQSAKHVCSSK
jgi:hypothetical protein